MPHEGPFGPGSPDGPSPSNGNPTSSELSNTNASSPLPFSMISGNQDAPDQSGQSQGQPAVLGTCFQDSSDPPDALTLSGWSLQVPDLFFGVETQEEQIPPSDGSECGPDGNREDTGVITPPKERVSPSIQSLRTWRQRGRVVPDHSEAEEEQEGPEKKEKDSSNPKPQGNRSLKSQEVSLALLPAADNQQGTAVSSRQSQLVLRSEESKGRPKSHKYPIKGNESSKEDQCQEGHFHHCEQQQQLQEHSNGSEEEGHSPLDPDITTCQLPCCSGKRKSKGKCQRWKDSSGSQPPKPPAGEQSIVSATGSPSVVKSQSSSPMTLQSKGPSVVSHRGYTETSKSKLSAALATQKKTQDSIRQRHPILSMPKYERKCLAKFVTDEGVRTGHEDRYPSVLPQGQNAEMSPPSVENPNQPHTIQESENSVKEVIPVSQAQENGKLVNERDDDNKEGDSSSALADEGKQESQNRDGNTDELCLVSALKRSLSIGQEEIARTRSEDTPSAEGQHSESVEDQPKQQAMEIDGEIKQSKAPLPLSDTNVVTESPQEPERSVAEVSANQPQQIGKLVEEQSDSDRERASSAGSAGILEELAEYRDGNIQLPSEPAVSGGLLPIGQSANEKEKDAPNKVPSPPRPANGERLEQHAMDTDKNMEQSMVPSSSENAPSVPKSRQETESAAPEVSASQLQESSQLIKEQSDGEQEKATSSSSAGTIAKLAEDGGEATQKPHAPAVSGSSLATDQSANRDSGDISNGSPSSASADGSLEPEAMETDGNPKESMVPSLPENRASEPSSMRETERSAPEVAASQLQQNSMLVKGQSDGEQDKASSSCPSGTIAKPAEDRSETTEMSHTPEASESSLATDQSANEESGDISNGSSSLRSADGSLEQEAMDEDESTKESMVSSSPESCSSGPQNMRESGRTAPGVAASQPQQQISKLVNEQRNGDQDRPFSFLAAGRSEYLEYHTRDRDGNIPSCFMPYSTTAWGFRQYGSVIGGSTEISNAGPSLGLPQGRPEQQTEHRDVNTSQLVVPLPLRASTFGPQITAAFMQELWIRNSEPRDEGISTMQSGESGNQEGQQTDGQVPQTEQHSSNPGQGANGGNELSTHDHGPPDSDQFAVYERGLLGIYPPEVQAEMFRKSMDEQRRSHRRFYGDSCVQRFHEESPEGFRECDNLFGPILMHHFLCASTSGTLGSRELEFLNMIRSSHQREFPEKYSSTSSASSSVNQSQQEGVLNDPSGASHPAVHPVGTVPTYGSLSGSVPVVNTLGTPNDVASAGDQSVPQRPSEVVPEAAETIPSVPPASLFSVPNQSTVTVNVQGTPNNESPPHQKPIAGVNTNESTEQNHGERSKPPAAAVQNDMHVKEPFPSDTEDSSTDGEVRNRRTIVQKVEDWKKKTSHLVAGQMYGVATPENPRADEAGPSKPPPPEAEIIKAHGVPKDGPSGSCQGATIPTSAPLKHHEAEARPLQKPPSKETASQSCQTETLLITKIQQVDIAIQTDPATEPAENNKTNENERKEEEGKARGCKRKASQPSNPCGCQLCQVASGIAPKPPSEHDSGHEDSDGPSSPKNKRVSGASTNNQGLPAEQPTVVKIRLDKGPVPSSSQHSSCQVLPLRCKFHAKYTCSSCHQPNEQPCVFDACASHAILHGGHCRSAMKESVPPEGTAAVRINCQGVDKAKEGQCPHQHSNQAGPSTSQSVRIHCQGVDKAKEGQCPHQHSNQAGPSTSQSVRINCQGVDKAKEGQCPHQHSNQAGPSTSQHSSCQGPQKVTKSRDNQPSTSANLGGLAISGMNTDDVFIWRRSDPLPRDVLGEAAIHFQTMLGATRMQASDTFGYPLGAMFAGGQQLAGRLQMPGLLPISIKTTVAASAPGTSQMHPQAGVANQGQATANMTRRRGVKRLKYRASRVKSSIATQARLTEARKSSAPNSAGQKDNPGPSGTKQPAGMKKTTNSGKSRSPARQVHTGPLTRQKEEELYSRYPQRISLRISERQYKKWCAQQDFQQAVAAVEGDQDDQDGIQQGGSTISAGQANGRHSMDAPGPSTARPHQGKRGGGRTNGWASGAT